MSCSSRSSLWTRAVAFTAIAVAFASVVACSTSEPVKEGETVSSTESELKLSGGVRYLGKIAPGESRTGSYYNPPRFRSYMFDAKAGDAITIAVKSESGDAVAYLTDASYNVLAYNDDSEGTLDSKITYTVPADGRAQSYRIAFRDYDLLDATFTVSLEVRSTQPTTCAYDGQTYQVGASFPSTDRCNTCSCGEGGMVACTKKACICDPANEPNRTYLGSPQQCLTMRYTCPAGSTAFQNSCGCGCER